MPPSLRHALENHYTAGTAGLLNKGLSEKQANLLLSTTRHFNVRGTRVHAKSSSLAVGLFRVCLYLFIQNMFSPLMISTSLTAKSRLGSLVSPKLAITLALVRPPALNGLRFSAWAVSSVAFARLSVFRTSEFLISTSSRSSSGLTKYRTPSLSM